MKQEQIRREFAVMNNAYRMYSFSYFLDSMEALGLMWVDLWGGVGHFDPYEADRAYIKRVKGELNARGLKIAAYTPELLGYPYNLADQHAGIREASLSYCRRNIEIAAELEAPVMLISPGWGMWDEPFEEAFMRAADSLGKAAETAKQCEVMLAIEHLTPQSSNLLTNADAVCRMIGAAGHPWLGAALDLGQMSVFGENVKMYLDRLGEKIRTVHMMDGTPESHLAFGDGVLPLREYYGELRAGGYKGRITLEINDGRYGKRPGEALKQCIDALGTW